MSMPMPDWTEEYNKTVWLGIVLDSDQFECLQYPAGTCFGVVVHANMNVCRNQDTCWIGTEISGDKDSGIGTYREWEWFGCAHQSGRVCLTVHDRDEAWRRGQKQ